MLSVQDRGIGVPADEQARVFEPFHRAANAAHVAGTGIGLTSVRRIAEAHGGAVSLESREGIGTTVTLRLPLEG
jgi:signal transduction histidine kinase